MIRATTRTLLFLILFFTMRGSASAAIPECLPSLYPHHTAEGKVAKHYRNNAWGYEIEIPEGLEGWDDSAGPHHGFGISFGDQPKSYILVNGEANTLEYASAVDAALRRLSSLREDGKEIVAINVREVHLGTLPAVEVVSTYSCPGSPERYTMASILAIGPKKTPFYEVTLYARASRFQRDRRVFDELLKSWRYTGY